MQTKNIAIFGASGSIGKSTIEVIRAHREKFYIYAVAVHSNTAFVEKLLHEFTPKKIVIFSEEKALSFKKKWPSLSILSGKEGLCEIASDPCVDFVMLAMSGIEALEPAICAIKAKKQIGLANKELLVSAGKIIQDLCEENKVTLLPVDSEHSAIFQCMQNRCHKSVHKLLLTASGGPFNHIKKKDLHKVTLSDALTHPNWKMGPKITIDSSTMMNKGLEVIEAHWLFGIELTKIQVVIHPQSIIHSMVEFVDHSILAQMSKPSMVLPIQNALSYPATYSCPISPLDFSQVLDLHFSPPDIEKFPCLALAYLALKEEKSYCCYLNSANEVLVQRFLQKEISWMAIGEKLKKLITSHTPQDVLSLEAVLEIDSIARKDALQI